MSENSPAAPAASAVAVTSGAPPTGRLAMLTAYAVAATAIPIPFVPDRVIAGVRGALVHDVVSRHGMSITSDARAILAGAQSDQRARLMRAAETVVRQVLKRFRPASLFQTAARGVEVYALGKLLDHYITHVRKSGAVRIHAEEARRVREAIDKALLRTLSPALRPKLQTMPSGAEDLRDEYTRWIDAIFLTGAAIPSYLERRLEAAFDEIVRETPGLSDG